VEIKARCCGLSPKPAEERFRPGNSFRLVDYGGGVRPDGAEVAPRTVASCLVAAQRGQGRDDTTKTVPASLVANASDRSAPIRSNIKCDMPDSPAGARYLTMSRCEPTRILVGASLLPTSENRNNMRRARPREVTFTRHEEKSFSSFGSHLSPEKLTSTCQPVSPVSSG
jgi:hypothetical protein